MGSRWLARCAVVTFLFSVRSSADKNKAVPIQTSADDCLVLHGDSLLKDSEPCLPKLNFGTGSSTSRLDHKIIANLTETWIRLNPRLAGVDTAWDYFDEDAVGNAVHSSGVNRSRLFLTTKIPCSGKKATNQAMTNLMELKLASVDLLLVHFSCAHVELLKETWSAVEENAHKGLAKRVGVSNFGVKDLEQLQKLDSPVRPAVNQILMHVGCMPDPSLVILCAERGIILQAYSPLGKGLVLKNPTVRTIAASVSRSPAQVALQYIIQKGFSLVSTTSKENYMVENKAILHEEKFSLSERQMAALDALDIPCKAPEKTLVSNV